MSLTPATSYIDDFSSLQKQMDEFSARFEQQLIAKRSAIMNSKQSHYVKMHELESQETSINSNIKNIKLKIEKTKELVSKMLADLQNQQVVVDDLARKYQNLDESKSKINEEISELNKSIHTLNTSYETQKASLSTQAQQDLVELSKYEMFLGLKIDLIEENLLRLKFFNVDPHDVDREVWADLYVGGASMEIRQSAPELSQEKIDEIRAAYDKQNEFIVLLKLVRAALREATNDNQ